MVTVKWIVNNNPLETAKYSTMFTEYTGWFDKMTNVLEGEFKILAERITYMTYSVWKKFKFWYHEDFYEFTISLYGMHGKPILWDTNNLDTCGYDGDTIWITCTEKTML